MVHHTKLDQKIEQERDQGFRFGPFRCPEGTAPPLFNLKCHPRSAAIKKFSDKVRLVVDMSSPYDGTSVNANCPDVELHYVKLDNAGSVLKKLGQGTLLLKFDVTAAYKQIRLIIDDWCLQGEMYSRGGITWRKKFWFSLGRVWKRSRVHSEMVDPNGRDNAVC